MSDAKITTLTHKGQKLTPQQVLADALSKASDIDSVVVVAVQKESGDILVGNCASANPFNRVAMLEVAKAYALEEMSEE